MDNFDKTIVSRPGAGAWSLFALMLFFCAGFGAMFAFDPPRADEVWLARAFVAALGVVAAGLLIYIARRRVIADDNGLRWRGAFTRWKHARWNEVSDFYTTSLSPSPSIFCVETPQGKVVFGHFDSHADELSKLIARRARGARYDEWGIKGLRRDESFEHRFAARTISMRAFALTFAVLFGATLAVLIFFYPSALTGRDVPAEFVNWYRATLLMGALVFSIMPAALLAEMVGKRLLGEGETLVATPTGLRFEARGRDVKIEWRELRAVKLLASGARFETRDGVYQWHWNAGLRPIIERYAPHALLDVAANENDVTSPTAQSDGTTFYSFRTETFRLMLLSHVLPLIVPLPILIVVQLLTPDWDWPSDWWTPALFMVPITAAGLWLWRLYSRGGILLSTSGVTVRGAWRERFYRWNEIEAHDDKLLVRRGKRRVQLWSWMPPVRCDEVRAEIERRIG